MNIALGKSVEVGINTSDRDGQTPLEPSVAALDAEMTLTLLEGLEYLARLKKGEEAEQHVRELTNNGMAGAPFLNSLEARLRIIGTITDRDWLSLVDEYICKLDPGAPSAINAFREAGADVHVISGGFEQGLFPVAEHLGIPRQNVHALNYNPDSNSPNPHDLLQDNGKVIVFERLVDKGLAKKPPQRPIHFMIGDGMTDARVKKVPNTTFMAVGNRLNVIETADYHLGSLADIPSIVSRILAEANLA